MDFFLLSWAKIYFRAKYVLKGAQRKYSVTFQTVVTKYIQLLAGTNAKQLEMIVVIVECL